MPKTDRDERDRGPEVRLLGDEKERHDEEEPGDDEVAVVAGAAAVLAEVHRQHERDAMRPNSDGWRLNDADGRSSASSRPAADAP